MARWPGIASLLAVLLFSRTAALATPNVVFFFIDTLRADHCSCLGYARPTTPSLDELARRGTLFERAYAQADTSLASYTTVFTSLHPAAHGVFVSGAALDDSVWTLAGILGANGYQTAAFVAGGQLAPSSGLGRGFDTYWSTRTTGSFFRTAPRALEWLDRRGPSAAARPTRPLPPARGTERDRETAGKWDGERPFFLMVQGYDAHVPYSPPLGFGEVHDPGYHGLVHEPGFLSAPVLASIHGLEYDAAAAERARLAPSPGRRWAAPFRELTPPLLPDLPGPPAAGPSAAPGEPRTMSAADLRHVVAHYDGAVTYADLWLGLFLEGLESRGLRGSTIVVVAGDHGESLGEHEGWGHGFVPHDSTLHVPLAVSGPGVARGRRVADLVGLIDLAPTVLSLCGIAPCRQHQGASLLPYLGPSARPPSGARRILFASGRDTSTSFDGTYRLLRRVTASGQVVTTLHEPSKDPSERNDLSSLLPDAARRLSGQLQDHLERFAGSAHARPSSPTRPERSTLERLGYW
ncbi:MAG: sulfatase-like hydrolase/transferase [Candidatus Riflebacteria bacterium]|nr:sulfatase-like hydrolase/transferase [Candidatus Riflebacteria bacterium]